MTSLAEVRVSRDAILHNLKTFQEAQRIPVAPVLKSNAYGHGLAEIGGIVADAAPFACVASLAEAQVLRAAGVSVPLLIISYTPLEALRENTLADVSFAVVSIEELRRLAASGVSARVHLEFDTGMHRHGIQPEFLDEAFALSAAHPQIAVEGIYSHLADGDTKDSELTRMQIAAWNAIAKTARERMPGIRYFHLSATTGVAFAKEIDANVARLGLGLYGFNDSLLPLDIRPALEMRTRVASVRTVRTGERVGYNGTYAAESDRRIATVPVGYYEGIDRRLSNKGAMLIRGKACPIVGRVSMNITSLDVTDIPDVSLDEEVIAISANPADPNSVANIAQECDTISYEVLVNIPSELPRAIV